MEIAEKRIEELELSRIRMTITVPAQDLRSEYDAMINEYAKQARIDGFRKGHVPISVLERKFGPSLKTDAMARVVEKALETALKDVSRPPLAYEMPELENDPSFELDSDFTFSVSYDAFPVFELPSLDGIEIEIPAVAITQEDIDRELEDIRQRNAIVVEKDGPSEIGDIVIASFVELAEDGSEISGT